MAENKDIFCMYCYLAISRLQQEGLIKGDRDWHLNGSKFTIQLYNKTGRNDTNLVVVHDRGYKTITVIETAKHEVFNYNFTPEEIEDRKRFTEAITEYAKKVA